MLTLLINNALNITDHLSKMNSQDGPITRSMFQTGMITRSMAKNTALKQCIKKVSPSKKQPKKQPKAVVSPKVNNDAHQIVFVSDDKLNDYMTEHSIKRTLEFPRIMRTFLIGDKFDRYIPEEQKRNVSFMLNSWAIAPAGYYWIHHSERGYFDFDWCELAELPSYYHEIEHLIYTIGYK